MSKDTVLKLIQPVTFSDQLTDILRDGARALLAQAVEAELKWGRLGRVRRSTLICWRNTSISASSATRDRNRSIAILKISLHKSNIEQQHRPILDQPPADWIYDRDTPTNKPSSTRSPHGSTTETPTTPKPTGNSQPKMPASNSSIYTRQSD